jgi:uncharacterized radical SAM superfamily Fe-S cluster-containing enzyme
MNILLNNYCNLDCNYCFANEILDKDKEKMTLDNFRWLLGLLERSNNKEVRLIGGEPTLHPNFTDFVLEAGKNTSINKILIFTNGTYPERYNYLFDVISKNNQVSLLINFNHKNDINSKKYNQIMNNIQILSNLPINLTLGINFYKKDQDYDYIINTAKKYNCNKIRWSLVVPNNKKKKNQNLKKYFRNHIPNIINFITDCKVNNIDPHVDCNNFPICLLDNNELRKLAMIDEHSLKTSICNPVIDVQPNMEAMRCFIMNNYKVNIKQFNNLQDIEKHFKDSIDSQYLNKPLFNECENCASFQLNNKSCTCLAYPRK